MPNFNQIQLMGHCGRDVESKFLPSGDPVASVSVAVTEKYKGKETTTWFDCSFFGKQAEIAQQYLRKGAAVFIQGPVALNVYTKGDGSQGASLRVTVRDFKMLGGRPESAPETRTERPAPKGTAAPRREPVDADLDDIPFSNPYRGKLAYII